MRLYDKLIGCIYDKIRQVIYQKSIYREGKMNKLEENIVYVFGDGDLFFESEEDLCIFVQNDAYIHFVCMKNRLGTEELTTKLEFTHYKPQTARNDLMVLRVLLWSGIVWFVISIPASEKYLMEEVVSLCGMRIVNGVPTIFEEGKISQFPIKSDNVFTLENVRDHPVYQNDPSINTALKIAEQETIEKIRNGEEVKKN